MSGKESRTRILWASLPIRDFVKSISDEGRIQKTVSLQLQDSQLSRNIGTVYTLPEFSPIAKEIGEQWKIANGWIKRESGSFC